MSNLCVSCKEREVEVRKWMLCKKCYGREYRKRYNKGIKLNESFYVEVTTKEREMDFVKVFFKHTNWVYGPATFRLDSYKYTPDFYDGERNVFIEVSGTRQAYHANKYKYDKFRELFPKLGFEIRKENGELLDEKHPIWLNDDNSFDSES